MNNYVDKKRRRWRRFLTRQTDFVTGQGWGQGSRIKQFRGHIAQFIWWWPHDVIKN